MFQFSFATYTWTFFSNEVFCSEVKAEQVQISILKAIWLVCLSVYPTSYLVFWYIVLFCLRDFGPSPLPLNVF